MSIQIHFYDQVFCKIQCDRSILFEIKEQFTFEVPGAKFSPQYKSKLWDGKISLLNLRNQTIYVGLIPVLVEFLESRGYTSIEVDPVLIPDAIEDSKLNEIFPEFLKSVTLPEGFEVRDYQYEAVKFALQNKRGLLLSPTGSGKSLIIYLILRFLNKKTLIIVPSTQLVRQLASDFHEYGYSQEIYQIMAGVDKTPTDKITISTWQSIVKQPKAWFEQFNLIIGDEAHSFKATSLKTIMEKTVKCEYKIGTTGTLDDSKANKFVLEGLFGPVKVVAKTRELIDSGILANLKIKVLLLQYTQDQKKSMAKSAYQDELAFLFANEKRNKFIYNLARNLKGNSLLLFHRVETHGKILYESLKETNKQVFFIHGGIDVDFRENVRKILETNNDCIIVASFGTFRQGINIKNLNNVVFTSPSKAQIQILQSIGRGLRTHELKDRMTLYDIADDLRYKKSYTNYTYTHLLERLKIYANENFDYNTIPFSLYSETS